MLERSIFVNSAKQLSDAKRGEIEEAARSRLKEVDAHSMTDEHCSHFHFRLIGEHVGDFDFRAFIEDLEDEFKVRFTVVQDDLYSII